MDIFWLTNFILMKYNEWIFLKIKLLFLSVIREINEDWPLSLPPNTSPLQLGQGSKTRTNKNNLESLLRGLDFHNDTFIMMQDMNSQ